MMNLKEVNSAFKKILLQAEKFQNCTERKTSTPFIKNDFKPLLEKATEALKEIPELSGYYVFYSKGASNFPEIPWIAIKEEDNKASKGIYLLFRFYLLEENPYIEFSLNQGYREYNNIKEKLKARAEQIRCFLKETDNVPNGDEITVICRKWETNMGNETLLTKYLQHYKNYCDNRLLIYANNTLKSRHNIVLSGAPGTGKTYLAKEIAANLISPGSSYENLEIEQKIQIEFVQFHPSYNYSDFVEGLRSYDKGDSIGFSRQDGIFKKFCKKALKKWNEELLNVQTNLDIKNTQLTPEQKSQIYEKAKKEAPKFIFIIDEINRGELSKIFGELFYSIDPGYRGESGKVNTQYQTLVDYESDDNNNVKSEALENKIPDAFANGFFVPENVYIIGTMNDIDRSVEPMDFAVRRRFVWIEVKPEDRVSMWGNNKWTNAAKIAMNNINLAINAEETLGEAYCLGPAYFNNPPLLGNNIDLYDLWELRIKNVLKEYLRTNPAKQELLALFEKVFFEPNMIQNSNEENFSINDIENLLKKPKQAKENSEDAEQS